jgi:nucleoid-associated protein YgaU
MKDYEALKSYIQTNLNGSVGAEYSSPEGQGRIAVLGTASSEPAGTASAGSSYTVQKGDWLCRIASSVYGDGSLWKKIYEANTGIIADPDLIYAGQELKIPAA